MSIQIPQQKSRTNNSLHSLASHATFRVLPKGKKQFNNKKGQLEWQVTGHTICYYLPCAFLEDYKSYRDPWISAGHQIVNIDLIWKHSLEKDAPPFNLWQMVINFWCMKEVTRGHNAIRMLVVLPYFNMLKLIMQISNLSAVICNLSAEEGTQEWVTGHNLQRSRQAEE